MRARCIVVCTLVVCSFGCAIGDEVDDGVLAPDDAPKSMETDPPYETVDATAIDATAPTADALFTDAHRRRDARAPTDAPSDVVATDAIDLGVDAGVGADDDAGDAGRCGPVINEVQTAGATSADEFVEIANPCGTTIAVGGFTLVYRSRTNVDAPDARDLSTVYAFEATATLPPSAHFVVGGSDFAGAMDGSESTGIGRGMLASIGGQLAIRDDGRRVVDAVFYGSPPSSGSPAFLEEKPANAPPAGSSIARHPDGFDSDDGAADFADCARPTPGAANP